MVNRPFSTDPMYGSSGLIGLGVARATGGGLGACTGAGVTAGRWADSGSLRAGLSSWVAAPSTRSGAAGRAGAAAAGLSSSLLPHTPQKRAPASRGVAHFGQLTGTVGLFSPKTGPSALFRQP